VAVERPLRHLFQATAFSVGLAQLLILLGAMPARGADRVHAIITQVDYDRPIKARKAVPLTAVLDVPNDIGRSESLRYDCFLNLTKSDIGGRPAKGVKAQAESTVSILDHRTGALEETDLFAVAVETDDVGKAVVPVEIPATVAGTSTEAFERGDLTVQVAVGVRFVKGRKVGFTKFQCILHEPNR